MGSVGCVWVTLCVLRGGERAPHKAMGVYVFMGVCVYECVCMAVHVGVCVCTYVHCGNGAMVRSFPAGVSF